MYNQADFDGMCQYVIARLLNTDLKNVTASTWDKFKDVMQKAIKLFIPVCSAGKGIKETNVDDRQCLS